LKFLALGVALASLDGGRRRARKEKAPSFFNEGLF